MADSGIGYTEEHERWIVAQSGGHSALLAHETYVFDEVSKTGASRRLLEVGQPVADLSEDVRCGNEPIELAKKLDKGVKVSRRKAPIPSPAEPLN